MRKITIGAAVAACLISAATSAAPARSDILAPSAPANTQAALAEKLVRTVISEAMSGFVDHTRMEPDIVPAVKLAQAGVIAKLRSYGPTLSIVQRGNPSGRGLRIYKFDVEHARGRSQWRISLAADGRISNLLFQPR